MSTQVMNNHDSQHEHDDHGATSRVVFGFWIYIMSDCILFACIFATYAVLHGNTFGGPGPKELFSMPYILVETFILLTSSFTYGLVMLAVHKGNKNQAIVWLIITFLLGLSFVGMEVNEFHHLIAEGNGPQRSAFLSSFFTLVGTHGLHVTCGLIWMILLMLQVAKHGITNVTLRKLTCLSLFWHFLDIVWIFVFTIVYLMGAM
ncbi:MAG: cytochrome o ubiquinol oxidase subunit III [Burkholderiales bacterium]